MRAVPLPRTCEVVDTTDRTTIRTTPKRAEAILLVMSGSTLAEAGKVLGITRERVRQYLEDAHVNAHQRQRFTKPQRYDQQRFARTTVAEVLHAERRERLRQRLASVAGYIATFHRYMHRAPTYPELWELVTGLRYHGAYPCNALLTYLGRGHRERRSMRRLWVAFRMAGVTPNTRGHWVGRKLPRGPRGVTVRSPHAPRSGAE